jgi:long-chain acyl-CoA synthetase
MNFPNIYSLFRAQTAKYRGKPIFYSRGNDGWKSQNWEDFEEQVHDFACALLAKGLTKGASVAILAGNVPEWTICDVGTIAAGGVGVGIYPTSSPEQCAYIINHSEAEFVVGTSELLGKIYEIQEPLPKLKEIICLVKTEEYPPDAIIYLENFFVVIGETEFRLTEFCNFLSFGKEQRERFFPQVENFGFNAKPEDTAIMVYTSGTTGQPKGAMLSHQYVLNSCESLRQSVPIYDTDVSFYYLPGCHVAERNYGIYNRL